MKPIGKTCLVREPGIYKINWHNKHSYMKAKTVKYRIRVLVPQEGKEKISGVKETDLLSLGELNSKQRKQFDALRLLYPSFIPMVRILRPSQTPSNAFQHLSQQ